MLPFIAIPLLHSSGAWIASTVAGGYLAGTLSSTWIGAFFAGNVGILSSIGAISAAGVYAAIGGVFSTAGAAVGTGLSAVGLTGLAQSMGLVPATFLGLTAFGWAVLLLVLLSSGFIFYFLKKKLKLINSERLKGGLPSITWREILNEVKDYEKRAMTDLLRKLSEELHDVIVLKASDTVEINGKKYNIQDLKYLVKKDGTEHIFKSSIIPFKKSVVFTVINSKMLTSL